MTKILLYGNNPQLLLTRRLILEKSGSQVFATSEIEQEMGLMTTVKPAVLILCQSLNRDQREMALIMARELLPQIKSLVMMDAGEVYDLGSHNVNIEALYALDGPQALLTTVDRMLHRHPNDGGHAR